MEEKQKLLTEAAQALQSQEDKHKERIENFKSRLDHERERRLNVEKDNDNLRQELRDARENIRDEERRISDESRLLYAEAFGSFNLGIGASAKSDSEVNIHQTIVFNLSFLAFRLTK